MENSFQTSFIPKKSIVATANVYSSRSSSSFFTKISVVILIIVGIVALGLFTYKSYLTKQKVKLSTSLLKVSDYFNKDTIDELQLFDKRVSSSKDILNSHLVFSPLFSLLNDLTIPSVQYTKFEEDATDKGFFVKISGIARDYKSVALQAGVFNSSKGRNLKDVVFSNLVRDKNSNITFDLDFKVDPALLSYEKNTLLDQSKNQAQAQP